LLLFPLLPFIRFHFPLYTKFQFKIITLQFTPIICTTKHHLFS
jgi:hypothetical protein